MSGTDPVRDILTRIQSDRGRTGDDKLHVTLSYAQSLDGCLSASAGEQLKLSGEESMKLTHGLRAIHDGILVGVGTVIADDPSLTVRYVEGPNPLPIVVDSNLRIPMGCKLLSRPSDLIIATTDIGLDGSIAEKAEKADTLQKLGVRLVRCRSVESNGRASVDLCHLFDELSFIRSLMVEGGAGIITSCLAGEVVRRISNVVLTICPIWVGGFTSVTRHLGVRDGDHSKYPGMEISNSFRLGKDLIISGYPIV